MLITQIGLLMSIAALGLSRPGPRSASSCWLGAVAFLSATQDIALDAYRRELLPKSELGLGNAVHVNAYRIAGLVPGLAVADPRRPPALAAGVRRHRAVHAAGHGDDAAGARAAGGAARRRRRCARRWWNPSTSSSRAGWREALLILAFIFLYKLGDSMCTALATPFYLDMGFTKSEIGLVAKHAGLWPSVIGGLLGGLWMVRLGINRALWLFGVVQLVSILGFAWLAWLGPHAVGADQRRSWRWSSASRRWASGSARRPSSPSSPAPRIRSTRRPSSRCSPASPAVPRTFINATTGWLVEQTRLVRFLPALRRAGGAGHAAVARVAPWNPPRAA
jgi:PAT family beta-lactamase induction signal transducer AmpG